MFNRFDKVKYVGPNRAISDEVGNNVGEVISKIDGSTGYVVDFGVSQAFVVSMTSIERARGTTSLSDARPSARLNLQDKTSHASKHKGS